MIPILQVLKLGFKDESKKEPSVFQAQILEIYCEWNTMHGLSNICKAKQQHQQGKKTNKHANNVWKSKYLEKY